MTYQKPATDSIPVFVANVESTTEQSDIVARGWAGGFHRTGVVDQTWLDGLGSSLCWITFESADFSGAGLSAAGITKADLLAANASKVSGVDMVYTNQNAIAALESQIGSIPVFWKSDTAPATHNKWSREWFPFKQTQSTTALSLDFDFSTKVLSDLATWTRAVSGREFVVYTQCKGTPMTVTTGNVGDFVLPGQFMMFDQLYLAHTQTASAIIMDGNRDTDDATFESKVGGNADYADHLANMADVYTDYKQRDGNGAAVFSLQNATNYTMIRQKEVT